MKMLISASLMLLTTLSQAGFTIPKSVFTLDQLKEAVAEAKEKKKALTFVYTDANTTCGLCVAASEKAFDNLKSHSVLVYMSSEDETRWGKLPPTIISGLHQKKLGRTVPMAIVCSPENFDYWVLLSYSELKTDDAYRQTKKQVASILKGETTPQKPVDSELYWALKDRPNFYIGTFEGIKDNALTLKMSNTGKIHNIPFDKLSPNAVEYARQLAGQASTATESTAETSETAEKTADAETENAAAELETWISKTGKSVKARFIKLEDNQLTLELENGKSHTIPLDKLNEASRKQAAKHL